jgi:hypothetical protein
MALFAGILGADVLRRFARCRRAVVALEARVACSAVTECRRQPAAGRMAIVATAGTGNVYGSFPDRCRSVMAIET